MSVNQVGKIDLQEDSKVEKSEKRLKNFFQSKEFVRMAFNAAQVPIADRKNEYRGIAQNIIRKELPHIQGFDGVVFDFDIPENQEDLEDQLSAIYHELDEVQQAVLDKDIEVLGGDLHTAFSTLITNIRDAVIAYLPEEIENVKKEYEFRANHLALGGLSAADSIREKSRRLSEIDLSKIVFKGQLKGRGGEGEIYEYRPVKLGNQSLVAKVPLKGVEPLTEGAVIRQKKGRQAIQKQLANHQNKDYIMGYAGTLKVVNEVGLDQEVDLYEELPNMKSLHDELEKNPDLVKKNPIQFLEDVFLPMCMGVKVLHDTEVNGIKGVVHRDLKPENFDLTNKKVTDYSIACENGFKSPTQTAMGTPFYMSPEALTGQEITTKSDIYALGAILYEYFGGKMHDENTPLNEILMKTFNGSIELEGVSSDYQFHENPDYNQYFRDQVKNMANTCLQKNHDSRFDIDELIHQTKKIIDYYKGARKAA